MSNDNTAEVLNTFFSNIRSNLNIKGYSNCDPQTASNISDPVLKCIEKNNNLPSILATGEVYNKKRRLPFFSKMQRGKILSKFKTTKVCHYTDIATKIKERPCFSFQRFY